MAIIRWTGNAAAVAQKDTFTPADVEVGDIFILTAAGPNGAVTAISYTATVATVANVTAGLVALWNVSTSALCTPVTAADNVTNLTLTADEAGVPFSVISSTVNGGAADTQTLTRAATVVSAGPKHWDSAGNWSGGAVPGGAAGQDVIVENWPGDILYGLDQSAIANALTSLAVRQSFTGSLGVDGIGGSSGTPLRIKTSALEVGAHSGPGAPAGSGRLRIDLGVTPSQVAIHNTGSPSDSTMPSLALLAESSDTNISVRRGSVGIAVRSWETSVVGNISQGFVSLGSSDSSLSVGAGVTLTSLTKAGGAASLACGAGAITAAGGTLSLTGTGSYTTINNSGCAITDNSVGTVATLNQTGGTTVSNEASITAANVRGGLLDLAQSQTPRTVGTIKCDPPAVVKYDPAVVTLTSEILPFTASGRRQVTFAAA